MLDNANTLVSEFDERANSDQRNLYWMYPGEDFRQLAMHLSPTYDLHHRAQHAQFPQSPGGNMRLMPPFPVFLSGLAEAATVAVERGAFAT